MNEWTHSLLKEKYSRSVLWLLNKKIIKKSKSNQKNSNFLNLINFEEHKEIQQKIIKRV